MRVPKSMGSRVVALYVLLALAATAAWPASCPANGAPLPTAAERQVMVPIAILRCFLPETEVRVIIGSIGHDPQATLTDPAYDAGKQNPDGSLRPPLEGEEIAALIDMHTVLDPDMSDG